MKKVNNGEVSYFRENNWDFNTYHTGTNGEYQETIEKLLEPWKK